MIVTIDGPAGAGKSSVARALASRLGFRFLDTGAMYRAVVYIALRDEWPLENPMEVARRAAELSIQIQGERIHVAGTDVTPHLRTPAVTNQVHQVADNPEVRKLLVDLQRQVAEGGRIVTEGRDQGSVAFPHADCKFFLTASPEERGQRRWNDLIRSGETLELSDVVEAQRERDRRDQQRPVGALVQPEDAQVVETDGKSLEEVVDELVKYVEQHRDK